MILNWGPFPLLTALPGGIWQSLETFLVIDPVMPETPGFLVIGTNKFLSLKPGWLVANGMKLTESRYIQATLLSIFTLSAILYTLLKSFQEQLKLHPPRETSLTTSTSRAPYFY